MGLSTAMSELKRLLDLDQGEQADPLLEKLKAIAARGRAGAVVTRLQIAPDMSNVTVESTLWIRNGDRWCPVRVASRHRPARRRRCRRRQGPRRRSPDSRRFQGRRKPGARRDPGRAQDASLRIGAATEKALGMARSAFNEDLQALALAVQEPGKDRR